MKGLHLLTWEWRNIGDHMPRLLNMVGIGFRLALFNLAKNYGLIMVALKNTLMSGGMKSIKHGGKCIKLLTLVLAIILVQKMILFTCVNRLINMELKLLPTLYVDILQ